MMHSEPISENKISQINFSDSDFVALIPLLTTARKFNYFNDWLVIVEHTTIFAFLWLRTVGSRESQMANHPTVSEPAGSNHPFPREPFWGFGPLDFWELG